MKSIFSILFLSLLFAVETAAQAFCADETRNAPAVLNLRLGMTNEEVKNVFGGKLKIKNKRKGEYSFFQNYIKENPPPALSGVRALYLRFFDGRLYQIEVFYEEKATPQTLENFIANVSEKFNFPVSEWQIEYGFAEINCGKYSLAADNVLNPRLQLTDEITRAEVEKSREKK